MRERTKNFVIYFRKEKFGPFPFSGFGGKSRVYEALFYAGYQKGHAMFIASGKESYMGEGKFKNLLKYDGEKFAPYDKILEADAILDRSGGLKFPSEELDGKVLNMLSFKTLCADKFATFECLGQWMAQSYFVSCQKTLDEQLKNFAQDDLVVLKPVDGMQGKDILIKTTKEMANIELKEGRYVLQEFVDTAAGIEGITTGRHDLRIVIVNGKIVLSHIRVPKSGSYLANVALGGSIAEVALEKIPKVVLDVAGKVRRQIDSKYNWPIYSIDFGLCGVKPYIFELNDQIGFPSEKMKNKDIFIDGIIDSLQRISQTI